MSDNDTTLESYEVGVQSYIQGTAQQAPAYIIDWVNEALSFIPVGGSILEIGSASGRDADYMEARGYKLDRTDATLGFVDLQRRQGHNARVLNAIKDDLGGPYDMVYANAVLLHFTREEALEVAQKVQDALGAGGIFAFSVKKGKGSETSAHKIEGPRFFQYWMPDELSTLVIKAGFEIVKLEEIIRPTGNRVIVIARKG